MTLKRHSWIKADLSKVEMTLSILESQVSSDILHLAHNPDVQTAFKSRRESKEAEAGQDEATELEEELIVSVLVDKIEDKKKSEEKVLVISDRALYLFAPGHLKKFLKRVLIKNLDSISIAQTGEEFVIHIQSDVSIWLDSPKRFMIIRWMNRVFHLVTSNEIPLEVLSEDRLSSSVVTKVVEPLALTGKSKKKSIGGAITASLRKIVSKKKSRFNQDGFDLDLSYITDQLIAMGFPSDDLEGLYRNPYPEVYAFLESKHKHRYKVYNLCSEKKYDPAKFHRRVARFPFDDHSVPPMKLILDFCEDVRTWLEIDPMNIVAIHCKAGKGRTGLMISCFLFFSKQCPTIEECLQYFGDKRTKDGKGVTIPSQKRWAEYFANLMTDHVWVDKKFQWGVEKPYTLHQAFLNTIPHFDSDNGSDPYFLILKIGGQKIYDSRDYSKVRHLLPSEKNLTIPCSNLRIQGALKFIFYDEDQLSGDDTMFSFFIDTSFIQPVDGKLKFFKEDLDKAVKDKGHKLFDEEFYLELTVEETLVEVEESKVDLSEVIKKLNQLSDEAAEQRRTIHQLEVDRAELIAENKKLRMVSDAETSTDAPSLRHQSISEGAESPTSS